MQLQRQMAVPNISISMWSSDAHCGSLL